VPPGEPQEVLKEPSGPRRLLDDRAEVLPTGHGNIRPHQRQLGETQDRRQPISNLVREPRRQLPGRRELLAFDELGLGHLEALEVAPGVRMELRIGEGEADLIRARFDERDLGLGKWLGCAAPK